MTKTTSYQKTIKEFFERSMILISDDYSYGYTQEECKNLWNELLNFNLPNADYKKFNIYDEHLVGTIITSATDSGQTEIICNPQKFITIFLLIKIFYEKCFTIQSEEAEIILQTLERCIWKTDEFGNIDMRTPRVESDFAYTEQNDLYRQNREFFTRKVDELAEKSYEGFLYFVARFLNNCILFQIESKSKTCAKQILDSINNLK